MNTRLIFALSLLAAFPLAAQAQDTSTPAPPPAAATTPGAVTLRYKFAPGQVRRYKMVVDTTLLMQSADAPAGTPQISHTEATVRQTVKDVRASDGAATFTSEIESLALTTNGTPVQIPDEPLAQIKQPRTLVMSPTGKILSIPTGAIPTGGMPGLEVLKSFLNGNYALPDNPVQVGQSWGGSMNFGMAGTQIAITSTLQKLDTGAGTPGAAVIAQKLSGTFGANPAANAAPLPMKMTGTITGTGTQHFDRSAGAIASQETTMQAALNMTMGGGGGQTDGAAPHTMQMNIQMHLTMDRLPDTPAVASPTP